MLEDESQTTILVANDESDQLEMVSFLLRKAGYRVFAAEDGSEGFRIAQRKHPHLLISDVAMPNVDGIELCRLVRADSQLRTTPILLVSAVRIDSASAVEGLQAGADDYLEVPFDPPRLIAKVARLLERKRAEEELERCVAERTAQLKAANQELEKEIIERRRAQEAANYDALTGLPSRILFENRLPQALSLAERHEQMLAVMFLDLDRFKTINDTLGHAIGDQLLRGVAERLTGCVRGSDTVARFAGDEFALLLMQIRHSEDAVKIAQRSEDAIAIEAQNILKALESPFNLDEHKLYLTASIGVGLYPDDGKDPETLLKNASAALYRAKEQGGNNYQFYTADMNAKALKRLALENNLRRALERDEFEVHYQPQMDINTGHIVGIESLVRWQHPELGLVSPQEFIPLAEETGLIAPIGEWILRTVCRQTKSWQKAGLTRMRVSVNLSAKQFEQPNLVEIVAQILSETNLDPDYLELELTESSVMANTGSAITTLLKLQQMRIKIAVDDFGSGYSSLSYLKELPIDTLKIDQSFVRDMTADPNAAAIVMAIITLAHNLKLKVIAEGVETEEQLRFLRLLRCDEIQGYLFSKPLPVEACERLLLEGQRMNMVKA